MSTFNPAVRSRTGKTPAVKKSKSHLRKLWADRSWNVLGLAIAAVLALPIYWMLNTAFQPAVIISEKPHLFPSNLSFSNFSYAMHSFDWWTCVKNSLIITAIVVVIGLVIGFAGALAIARFRFHGRKAFIVVVLIIQMIPMIVLLIPLFLQMQNFNLVNNLPGVIIVYMVFNLPYTIWTLRGFISNVPRELDEAALVDGCNRWQTFTKVIFPLAAPGLVATAVYGAIQALNEFIVVSTFNTSDGVRTITIWLVDNTTQRGTAWGPLMAGATMMTLPIVFMFLLVQKNISAGITAGAVKG